VRFVEYLLNWVFAYGIGYALSFGSYVLETPDKKNRNIVDMKDPSLDRLKLLTNMLNSTSPRKVKKGHFA